MTCPPPETLARRRRVARLKSHAFKHPWKGDQALTCPAHSLRTTAITEPGRRTQIVCTFDFHYHRSGWFKNSDYEQCLHVSVAHIGEGTEVRHIPPDLGGGSVVVPKLETPSEKEVRAWADEFFGPDDARMAWLEPAASVLDPYRMPNIVHLRLYYDQQMCPFVPKGEVYTLRPLVGLSPAKIVEGVGGDAR